MNIYKMHLCFNISLALSVRSDMKLDGKFSHILQCQEVKIFNFKEKRVLDVMTGNKNLR